MWAGFDAYDSPTCMKVPGEIWSDAIQEMLDQHKALSIPRLQMPIYLMLLHGMGRNHLTVVSH